MIVNVGIDIVVSKVVCMVESKVSDLARRVESGTGKSAITTEHLRSSMDILVALCPTLSVSDAERGVYHDCSLSETATTAVSTTRLRPRACHRVDG